VTHLTEVRARSILRKQKRSILLFMFTVLCTALVGSFLMPKKYSAIVLVHLLPRGGQEVKIQQVVELDSRSYTEIRDRARTQLQIIRSRKVREETLRRYNEAGYDDLGPDAAGLGALGKALWVGPKADTQLIEIKITYGDP